MAKLFNTTIRIIVVNLALFVVSAWGASHWFVLDCCVRVPRIQLWVRCDSGGWLADMRYPAPAGSAWSSSCDIATSDERALAFLDSRECASNTISEFQPTIDAFDAAGFWTVSLPGVRFLKENNGSPVTDRHRWALGIRHLLLFLIASIATTVYCRVYRSSGAPRADFDCDLDV